MKVDNNNQKAFWELVRAGLWEREGRLMPYQGFEWQEVYRLASEQSVLGLVLAGIEHSDIKPPQDILLQWIGEVQFIEQRNKAMNVYVAELIGQLRKKDIYALLVKGQGIAQCYERPLWRASGDIDLLLSDSNYEKAKTFLIPLASFVEEEDNARKHMRIVIDSWVVELHGTLHTRQLPKLNKLVDETQNEVFFWGRVRSWQNGATQLFLPSANNDVVFIFAHILQHFFGGGIGVRQICDWCRLLYCYHEELDVRLLDSRLRKAGIMTEWKTFAAIAVGYLGIKEEVMPLHSADSCWEKKASRILDYIIQNGNMGHNHERPNNSGVARDIDSLHRYTSEALQHLRVFPLDAVKVWCRMVCKGINNSFDRAWKNMRNWIND